MVNLEFGGSVLSLRGPPLLLGRIMDGLQGIRDLPKLCVDLCVCMCTFFISLNG